MVSVALLIGLLLPGVGFHDQAREARASLAAQAAATGRPKECSPRGRRAKKVTVWQKVRFPKLVPYCAHVARSHALLASDAKAALAEAEAASKEWPGRPGSEVAKGRALLALGKPEEALQAFEAAKKLDEGAIEEPKAIRDFGRALTLRGRFTEAAAAYRVLVPRAGLLGANDRATTLLEAAFASMADEAGSDAKPGPEGRFSEALAFLTEVRESETSPLRAEALLAMALVQDRRGDAAKATSMSAEASKQSVDVSSSPWVATKADADALRALALESRDPSAAAEAWAQYLAASPPAAFAAAARARQTELKKRGAAQPKQPKKTKAGR
ncbi:MAG: hypothetical protein JNL21_18735 [Myxococcales bacterium]|nr:hypothetical protein [Myxococcales bacterium]